MPILLKKQFKKKIITETYPLL